MSSSEEVNKKIQELEALKKEAGRWKLGGVVAVLAIVVICLLSLKSNVTSLVEDGPKKDKLLANLKEEADKQIIPDLKETLEQAQKVATEAIKTELQKLNDRLPEITAKAQQEAVSLANELQKEAEVVMEDTFQKMLDEREAKIRKMYPDVTQEKISSALANLQTEIERELNKLIEEMFINHLIAVNGIVQHIEMIKDDNDDLDLLDQDAPWEMATLVFEIVKEEFDGQLELP
jgi:hypothetical protein